MDFVTCYTIVLFSNSSIFPKEAELLSSNSNSPLFFFPKFALTSVVFTIPMAPQASPFFLHCCRDHVCPPSCLSCPRIPVYWLSSHTVILACFTDEVCFLIWEPVSLSSKELAPNNCTFKLTKINCVFFPI